MTTADIHHEWLAFPNRYSVSTARCEELRAEWQRAKMQWCLDHGPEESAAVYGVGMYELAESILGNFLTKDF